MEDIDNEDIYWWLDKIDENEKILEKEKINEEKIDEINKEKNEKISKPEVENLQKKPRRRIKLFKFSAYDEKLEENFKIEEKKTKRKGKKIKMKKKI